MLLWKGLCTITLTPCTCSYSPILRTRLKSFGLGFICIRRSARQLGVIRVHSDWAVYEAAATSIAATPPARHGAGVCLRPSRHPVCKTRITCCRYRGRRITPTPSTWRAVGISSSCGSGSYLLFRSNEACECYGYMFTPRRLKTVRIYIQVCHTMDF